MDIRSVPIIRMNIEHMKHEIAHHLGVHGSELGDAISKQVDIAVAQYDFEGEVLRVAGEVIAEEISNFFNYGDGRAVIQDAIRTTLSKLFTNDGQGSVRNVACQFCDKPVDFGKLHAATGTGYAHDECWRRNLQEGQS